uniref:HSFtype DNAbinding protein putative n=1 Tax=Albugo laibachii Nc14 TaxID=890382 RepID=F0WXF4_9STRA|nr:HSFtype DNAbinding protein putative [Albugo laibachii Nc14]|eukprot:CCA26146.1 HSFtype DNAbinding protein putative [Albugo laibachii Nc14]
MSLIPVDSRTGNALTEPSPSLLIHSFSTTTQPVPVLGLSPRNGLRKKQDDKPRDIAPFLRNLRRMLDVESPSILCWTDNGKAFEIRDMDKMMEFVLPKYFKHRKYTSFQRQLNYFNFKKWTKSKAVICTFSNEYFIRDDVKAALKISRKKSVPIDGKHGSIKRRMSRSGMTAALIRRSCTLARSFSESFFEVPETAGKADKLGIAIPISEGSVYGSCPPAFTTSYPSPTDVDLMLQGAYHSGCGNIKNRGEGAHHEGLNGSEFTLDCLDWIDLIMPTIETQEKSDQAIPFDQSEERLQTICSFQCDDPSKLIKAESNQESLHCDNVHHTFSSSPEKMHNDQ